MNYRYLMIRETYVDGEQTRIGYGIAAVLDYDGCTMVTESFMDLCPDSTPVERLVKYCNELKLDVMHLSEAVDDFLADL